jgi:hypothetical protein
MRTLLCRANALAGKKEKISALADFHLFAQVVRLSLVFLSFRFPVFPVFQISGLLVFSAFSGYSSPFS